MKDEKGRQIIRTDKKGIEEQKMNNDVVPQQKINNASEETHLVATRPYYS